MSSRECIRVSVKASLIDPSGKVVRVIEGEAPDPFDIAVIYLIADSIYGQPEGTELMPIRGAALLGLFSPSPLGYLASLPCFVNCPGIPSSPVWGPGIYFYYSPPIYSTLVSNAYSSPGYLTVTYTVPPIIDNVTYSAPMIEPDSAWSLKNSGLGPVSITITQNAANTSGSPINVYTMALVGALYVTGKSSPILIPITFYVFSPPIVWSPGYTLTASVTITIPVGIPTPP